MEIFHVRIDDRLIHGQVLVGWGMKYQYQAFVVCDEELAASDWEKEIYLAAVPSDTEGMIITPEELTDFLADNKYERLILLFRSPGELKKAVDAGFTPREVIVGGIHDKEGRKRIYDYLFLSEDDIAIFRELMKKGVRFIARDLPDHPAHDLKNMLPDFSG
jgi:PTS system mannose-specific IIB component